MNILNIDKPWLIRTYAGQSSAEASNALYRKNLKKGQTGLSVAFDLPTQTGYDSDHILSKGEVGKVGKWVMSAPPVKALESLTKFIIPQEDRRQRFMESLTQVKDNVFEFVKDGIDTIRGIEPTEGTQTKIVESESQMQAKAQRDADDEIQNEVIVLKQNVTQPVINNVVSGQPKFVYVNSKSPMLTEFV